MKKLLKLTIITLSLLTIFSSLTACNSSNPSLGHNHTWVDATCTTPKTCSSCGETTGSKNPIAHIGNKSCNNCNINYFDVFNAFMQDKGQLYENGVALEYKLVIDGKTYKTRYSKSFRSDDNSIFEMWDIKNENRTTHFSMYFSRSDKIIDKNNHKYYYMFFDYTKHGSGYDFLEGQLHANNITTSTTSLPIANDNFCSIGHTKEHILERAIPYLKLLLTSINKIFEENNVNIRTNHLGFTNYSIA